MNHEIKTEVNRNFLVLYNEIRVFNQQYVYKYKLTSLLFVFAMSQLCK